MEQKNWNKQLVRIDEKNVHLRTQQMFGQKTILLKLINGNCHLMYNTCCRIFRIFLIDS